MLSILKQLTLQEKLQNCVSNMCVWTNNKKHNNKTNNQTSKALPEPGIEAGSSRTQSECVASAYNANVRTLKLLLLYLS